MSKNAKKSGNDDDDGPELSKIQRINKIKNKIVRSKLYNEHKKEKKVYYFQFEALWLIPVCL